MAVEQNVKWFDLSRFNAALKVVPKSPLRGVAMTCLDVSDEKVLALAVNGGSPTPGDAEAQRATAERTRAWWDRLKELGFSTRAEFYREADESRGRAFRLYSSRSTFTLAEMQSIVPGVGSDDFKLMPVSSILHTVSPDQEMASSWKRFAEGVLSKEAVNVWLPRTNVFERPYAESRTVAEAWDQHANGGRFSLLGSDPTTRWFANVLDTANYRENALIAFYADLEAVLADGLAADDVQEATLPYALPMWVDSKGRIVALRDIRYAPEVLAQPPHTVVGSVAHDGAGLVVELLRQSRAVEATYCEEIAVWREWGASGEIVGSDKLLASIRKVVEADAAFCDKFASAASGQLDELLDPNQSKAMGNPRTVKLFGDWREEDFRILFLRARKYIRDGSLGDVFDLLKKLDAGARAQDVERAKGAAKDALRRVAEAVQDADSAPVSDKVRHEDAGEKIGGARKDFHRRAMTGDDLEAMNDYERKALVVKKNVWPPLDYGAMRDAGVSPQAAIAIKYLKDTLATEPDRRRDTDTPEADYIEAIGEVRDAIAEVKTLDEFAQVCMKLYDAGRGDTNYIYGGSKFQTQIGSDACHLLCDSVRTLGWKENERREACVPSKINREIRKRVHEGAEWSYLIKPKRERSDAEKEAEAEKSDQERELHRPHLDVVERSGGEDWRGGRDIVAQDLMDHFGFRAIEFGNWLPQDERQTVLNMAFDSLCDLADALGLPPRGISFDGELAVAFGSRGRGGKHAALAHYEPGREVINLTRMKGAGTLAHEWFHALDWHLGGRGKFLTQVGRPRFDGDPMPALVGTMMRRGSTEDELLARAVENANKGKEYAASWCYTQQPESRQKIDKVLGKLFEKARFEMQENAIDNLNTYQRSGNEHRLSAEGAVDYSVRQELEDEMMRSIRGECDSRTGFTKVKGKVEGNLSWMLRNMGMWVTVEVAREIGFKFDDGFFKRANPVDTDFLKQAKALDETRSTPYWSTEIELFARAGAQYVFYELADKGVRSDYLVYGADEGRYEQHPIGNPNPTGQDRLALKEHFSSLVEEYRVRLLRSMQADTEVEP